MLVILLRKVIFDRFSYDFLHIHNIVPIRTIALIIYHVVFTITPYHFRSLGGEWIF